MATAWEPASPTEVMSEGLCATSTGMHPSRRDNRRSASRDLTASRPSRICFQDSSRTTMRRSPGWASWVMARPQEFRQVSATPTAWSPSGSSRDRDSDWIGAFQST